jgi:hypothetical protein
LRSAFVVVFAFQTRLLDEDSGQHPRADREPGHSRLPKPLGVGWIVGAPCRGRASTTRNAA